MTLVANPFTGQVLNANPNGDNQYVNPDGLSTKKPKRKGFSVSRTIRSRDADPVEEVLFDGLRSRDEAWEAGHTWLMEHGLPYHSLDIKQDGHYDDMVSWEPDDQ